MIYLIQPTQNIIIRKNPLYPDHNVISCDQLDEQGRTIKELGSKDDTTVFGAFSALVNSGVIKPVDWVTIDGDIGLHKALSMAQIKLDNNELYFGCKNAQ